MQRGQRGAGNPAHELSRGADSAAVLILASASPRRSALLAQIGLPHRIVPAALEERRLPGEPPERCVLRLAEQKACQVQATTGSALPVLGADTAVLLDGEMLGKPQDGAAARVMLARLSGRTHTVLSGVAVVSSGGVHSALSCSEVRLRAVTAAECAAYWASGEPRDKAGGYAIQGLGALFVAELRGSYSGVMGLPLFETASLLAQIGLTVWPKRAMQSGGES